MSSEKLSPFDYVNDINLGKRNIMEDDVAEGKYAAFIVNRSLSYFPDTVHFANAMNQYAKLDNRMQYDFLRLAVRKRKRFSKWIKLEADAVIDALKLLYGYTDNKARQVLPLLPTDECERLLAKVSRGGKKK